MATKKKKPETVMIHNILTESSDIEIPSVSGIEPSAIAKVAVDSRLAAKNYFQTVSSFTIQGPAAYDVMDRYLGEIRSAKKLIDNLFNNESTGLIRPIRVGLDRLYALQRQLLLPLVTAEEVAKEKMAAFQLELKRERDEKERVERDRIRKVQAELDAKRKADEPAVRVSLMPMVVSAPPVAAHSSTAFVKRVQVTSVQQLVEAIEAGLVPEHIGWMLVTVDTQVLNAWFKSDPEGVESCPGLNVYEDAQIRGKR